MKRRFLIGLFCLPMGLLAEKHATVEVTHGKQACFVFRTPRCWHEVRNSCDGIPPPPHCGDYIMCRGDDDLHSMRLSVDDDFYTFRQGEKAAVLLGYQYVRASMKQMAQARGHFRNLLVPGEEHYEIVTGRHSKLRPITEEEWKSGTPMAITAKGAPANWIFSHTGDRNPREISFAGHSYPVSQPKNSSILDLHFISSISANQRFITVHSWHGHEDTCETFIFCFGPPSYGHYDIDLYDVASGRRLIALTGHYWDLEPSEIFDNTVWLGDRYFIVPLSGNLRKFLFCDLERLKPPKH